MAADIHATADGSGSLRSGLATKFLPSHRDPMACRLVTVPHNCSSQSKQAQQQAARASTRTTPGNLCRQPGLSGSADANRLDCSVANEAAIDDRQAFSESRSSDLDHSVPIEPNGVHPGQVGLCFPGKVILGGRDRTAITSVEAQCEKSRDKSTRRKVPIQGIWRRPPEISAVRRLIGGAMRT